MLNYECLIAYIYIYIYRNKTCIKSDVHRWQWKEEKWHNHMGFYKQYIYGLETWGLHIPTNHPNIIWQCPCVQWKAFGALQFGLIVLTNREGTPMQVCTWVLCALVDVCCICIHGLLWHLHLHSWFTSAFTFTCKLLWHLCSQFVLVTCIWMYVYKYFLNI